MEIELTIDQLFGIGGIILILLALMSRIAFNITDHNWSRVGWKQHSKIYIAYHIYLFAYIVCLFIYASLKFFKYFKITVVE